MAKTGEKGFLLEELLRAYFLRSGIFVVRSVPLQLQGDDLTDIDVWLYERPTGSSRRRQIVDAKAKLKPKAFERVLWTKGLCELLGVEGAYVATTDNRPALKQVASQLGLSILDGADLKRMDDSGKILYPERLSEEDFETCLKSVDKVRRNKHLFVGYRDLKSSLIQNFGAKTVNRGLEHFAAFSNIVVGSHPNSAACAAALRLAYMAAAITAIALDFSLAKIPFKSVDERRRSVISVIRYGDEDEGRGWEKIRIAAALVERYTPGGRAVSQSLLNAVREDYARIPAEIIADHVLGQLKGDALFRVARSMESEAFSRNLRSFDSLNPEEKSLLGILLDYAGIARSNFAEAWVGTNSRNSTSLAAELESAGPLFDKRL